MSQLCGILDKTRHPIPTQHLQQMQNAVRTWQPERTDVWQRPHVGLSRLVRFNTSQSRQLPRNLAEDYGSHQIVFDGRLDNRSELVARLGHSLFDEKRTTDDDLVLAAYQRWGKQCCQHLLGDFAFAVWDNQAQQLFLARDHIGIRPLFVAETSRYFAFASNKQALLALPWVDSSVNEQWVADLLCITKVSKTDTLYRGIQAVEPAHWMVRNTGQERSTGCYWQLQPDTELELSSDEEYIEQFQTLLKSAVSCRLASSYPIASELSGGLDSTTVTSQAQQLANVSNQQLIAVSHVFAPEHRGVFYPFVDETQWIDDLLAFAGVQHHIKLTACQQNYVECIEQSVRAHAGPCRSDINGASDELWANLKQHECRVLLSGFGGDQLVTSSGLGYVEEFGRTGQLATLWQQLRAEGKGLTSASKSTIHWLLRGKVPGMERLFSVRDQAIFHGTMNWQEYCRALSVNVEFAEAFGYPKRYLDHPTLSPWGCVRQRELAQMCRPAIQYRVEDSAVGAELAGVEYRYPLLDVRLLEFCLALPALQKRRNGITRRMIRVAGGKLLPDQIRWRRDKTRATVPTVLQRMFHDRNRIHARLETMKHALHGSSYFDWTQINDMADKFCSGTSPANGKIRSLVRAYQLMCTLTEGLAKQQAAA